MIKNKSLLIALAALALSSCKAPLAVADVQTQKNISITAAIPDDAPSDAMIAPYKKSMDEQMNAVISHTGVELTKVGDNSNLGNLLADYTLEGAADWAKQNQLPAPEAAVINIGGIRSTIGKGDIRLRHVYEVMPFENELVIVKMTGTQLQGLFDYYLKTQKNNPVAGFNIETDNGVLTKSLVAGQKIDDNKTYYIATSDYLALGGDNMKFFSAGTIIPTGIKLRDLYVQKFKANPEVRVPDDVRLMFKNKKISG